MNRKTIFAACLLAIGAYSGLAAQEPEFAVATVRPSQGLVQGSSMAVTLGNLVIRGYDLERCLVWAYDLPSSQIQGPAWLRETRFDIAAKAPDAADEARLRLMMRTLLTERFGMKLHRERKTLPTYELVLAKDGPRLHDSTAKDSSKLVVSTAKAPRFSKDKTGLIAEAVTMRDLGDQLSEPLQRPVVDKTGLTDRYDVRIDTTGYLLNGEGADPLSLIFTAFEHQLGLKLVAGKDEVEFLVIDAINQSPAEN
jgi:uncharacterized protein (TIGR03435 family)